MCFTEDHPTVTVVTSRKGGDGLNTLKIHSVLRGERSIGRLQARA
ncbi:hypothetical protein NSERUTF1_3543 [Nocardia seriolae]|nr:hypothetical protein NSERUTF1_3543 [Nocardia seriolae]